MGYRLNTVRIFTRDWARACEFYRDTLGLTALVCDESMGWAQFDVGGPSLAVEQVDEQHRALVGRFVGVSLEVDDIDRTYQALDASGVSFLGPPTRQPWGGVLAHFEDPDKNVLTLLGK